MQQIHTVRTHQTYRKDLIGLAGFDEQGYPLLQPVDAYDQRLIQAINALPGQTGRAAATNITDGLRVGVDMCAAAPRGYRRRIWLISDGCSNRESDRLQTVVGRAVAACININTIGLRLRANGSATTGNISYDEALLRRTAESTHRGRHMSVEVLAQLSNALTAYNGHGRVRSGFKPEVTVMVIDLSPSMLERMEGQHSKIEVVVQALWHLIHYKQKLFS